MHVVSLPNPGTPGNPKFLRTDDPALIQKWLRAEDRAGFGVYDIPNPLRPGATRHGKDAIAAIETIFFDVDLKDIVEDTSVVEPKLRNLLLTPSEIVNSGHGYHVKYRLREPIDADTDPDEFNRACDLQERLIGYFTADAAVRPWSLLRRPGTVNSKAEPHVPCEVIAAGAPVDIMELEELAEIVGENTLFTRKAKTNGHAREPAGEARREGPVDVEARLAAMRHKGESNTAIHTTQLACVGARMNQGVPLDDVVTEVLAATRAAGDVAWDWTREEYKICRMGLDLVCKDPSLAPCLNDELFRKYQDATENLALGEKLSTSINRFGPFFRQPTSPRKDKADGTPNPDGRTSTPPRKQRFRLVPFTDLCLGNDPLYRVDELIPIRGLVDVWGKAKCCKSFWTYDLCFHIAMGWEYRDRYVQQGTVVYCAFEGAHGYKKRKEALLRHYGTDRAAAVPLYLVSESINLITEHKMLITGIASQLGEDRPAVVVLDTLNKSLVGSENKDVDMGAYVRAAEAIRDAFDCVVIIVHHCGYDDTRPRGHSSLPAAVDAQLAVTREGNTVTVTVEMMRDGPEETQIVSDVQQVEVGTDRNGKTLTSLVVVPSDTEAQAERLQWPRSLSVLHDAIRHTLQAHGEPHQPTPGELPVRAVDQNFVRKQFYATYAVEETDPTKRQDTLKHAFSRSLKNAQDRSLIGAVVLTNGQPIVWLKGALGQA